MIYVIATGVGSDSNDSFPGSSDFTHSRIIVSVRKFTIAKVGEPRHVSVGPCIDCGFFGARNFESYIIVSIVE